MRGDHSLCDGRRCRERRAQLEVGDGRPAARESAARESVAGRVAEFLAALALPEDLADPKRVGSLLALRLADAIDDDGPDVKPAVVRELRSVMTWLSAAPAERADSVDELKVRRLARRVGYLLP
jgi:hypothetical protein